MVLLGLVCCCCIWFYSSCKPHAIHICRPNSLKIKAFVIVCSAFKDLYYVVWRPDTILFLHDCSTLMIHISGFEDQLRFYLWLSVLYHLTELGLIISFFSLFFGLESLTVFLKSKFWIFGRKRQNVLFSIYLMRWGLW